MAKKSKEKKLNAKKLKSLKGGSMSQRFKPVGATDVRNIKSGSIQSTSISPQNPMASKATTKK